MTKYIEYSDPVEIGEGPSDWVEIIHRIKWEDAAKLQHYIVNGHGGHIYETDDQAAEDYLMFHWGKIIEC